MKKILLLGGSGFLGSNFLMKTKDKEGLYIKSTFFHRKPSINGSNIEHVRINLANDSLDNLFKGIDTVIHLANKLSTFAILKKNPNGPMIENTLVNMRVIQAVMNLDVKNLVWISSMTGYPSIDNPKEEDFFKEEPLPRYRGVGWMSRYTEKVLQLYSEKHDLNVLVLRPTSIYGKFDDFDFETCHALPAMVRRVVERQDPITVFGSGLFKKDWIYADDLVDFCLDHANKIEGFEVLNIGQGQEHSLKEILENILKIDGFEDANVIYTNPDEPAQISRVNCEKITTKYGYQSKFPLEKGLFETIQWFRQYGAK